MNPLWNKVIDKNGFAKEDIQGEMRLSIVHVFFFSKRGNFGSGYVQRLNKEDEKKEVGHFNPMRARVSLSNGEVYLNDSIMVGAEMTKEYNRGYF